MLSRVRLEPENPESETTKSVEPFFALCSILGPLRQATGALRQATGPPRLGAGVEVAILRRVVVSWKYQKFKNGFSKNTKIPQHSTQIQNYRKWAIRFKSLFELTRFTHVFELFTNIQDLLRFHTRILELFI